MLLIGMAVKLKVLIKAAVLPMVTVEVPAMPPPVPGSSSTTVILPRINKRKVCQQNSNNNPPTTQSTLPNFIYFGSG